MKTLKIGIDARMFSDSFTGIGRYNFELTKRLFQIREHEGQPIEWVIFMNQPEFDQFNFEDHVKKVLVNAKHYSFREQWHFFTLLRREKCDLVHFTHFNLPLLYSGKFVVTIHDTTISFFPGKKMNVWWRKWAYNLVFKKAVKASSKIITVSGNTKKDVMKLYHIPTDKIEVIHNGLGSDFVLKSASEIEKVTQKYDINSAYLLYTGVWREHKNLLGLIRSFEILSQKQDLNLVITGKSDPFYPEVIQLVKDLNLESRVKFVGLVPFDDLVCLYNGAAVFVFPSFYEGFGFPPLEAMLTETPVAASKAASIPEVCGEAAHYFDPYKVENMTEVVGQLLNDKDLAQKYVEKGLGQVQKFSWNDCSASTYSVYQGAL